MPTSQITYSKNGEGKGGLNLADASQIPDSDFEKLENFRRDSSKRLITRRGTGKFGDNPDSKPCTSYFFHKRDDGGGKLALRFSGTKAYKYNEVTDAWDEAETGLSEFEVGSSGARTRWGFAVYKNVVICCNGIDNVRTVTIPGGVFTTEAALPKVRYFEYLQDRTVGGGEDDNPNTMYYPAAAAASVGNFADNAIVVGGDEQGIITGIKEAGQVVLCGKSNKIFDINFAAPSALALNAKEGIHSDRAWKNVGNGTIHFNNEGLNTLQPRAGVEGGQALEAKADSAKVNSLLKDIIPASYNSNAGFNLDNIEYDQYFFSFDSNGDDIPDKTLIRSTFTKDYTQYTIPPAYDYGEYITDDGEVKYILATATGGQMYEMETGFSDDGLKINYELKTKDWDFDQPEVWKDIERIGVFGLKNKKTKISVQIFFDGLLVSSATIDDDNIDKTVKAIPIGTKPIGSSPIGKGAKTVDLFPYRIHIPMLGAGGTTKVQIRMRTFAINAVWSLDKANLSWNGNTFDIIESAKIG